MPDDRDDMHRLHLAAFGLWKREREAALLLKPRSIISFGL